MYQIKVQHIQTLDESLSFFNRFEYTFKNMITKEVIEKDSIDDEGQGIEVAQKQINTIIQKKYFNKVEV